MISHDSGISQAAYQAQQLLQGLTKAHGMAPLAIRMILLAVGGGILRKVFRWIHFKFDDYMFPTAYILAEDDSYGWIMTWLGQDPEAQAQIRHFQLITKDRENNRKNQNMVVSLKERERTATWSTPQVIGKVLPTYGKAIRVRYQGSTLWVQRRSGKFARSSGVEKIHLMVWTWVFQKDALKNFIVATHDNVRAKQDQEIHIYHPKRINPTWQLPVSRPSRPWSSVLLPGTTKDDILKDMETFFSDKEVTWYGARGIPHRRGYLFHGTPGAGKTTLTTALASRLELDIYAINPGQRGMDDAKLSELFRDCLRRSIILIEDIDCVFSRNEARLVVEDEDGNQVPRIDSLIQDESVEHASSPAPQMIGGSHDLAPSTVSLSGLLNAIDGVSSQEGCILIASTNHPERLDPALSRAGRFDIKKPFFNAISAQARSLFLHFYPLADFAVNNQPGTLSTCLAANAAIDEKDEVAPLLGSKDKQTLGIKTQTDLDDLADRFVKAVFPSGAHDAVGDQAGLEVSMAALQGYLLKHKDDPVSAASEAVGWARSDVVRDWQKERLNVLARPPQTPGTPRLASPKPRMMRKTMLGPAGTVKKATLRVAKAGGVETKTDDGDAHNEPPQGQDPPE